MKTIKTVKKTFNLAVVAFALAFSSSAQADESGSMTGETAPDANMEMLESQGHAAYPWMYFGCVYTLPQCRAITWNSGFRLYWGQTDYYRCPGYMLACWGSN